MTAYPNGLTAAFSFSEAEREQIMSRFWTLLRAQAAKWNGMDSTSLPVERAQDLLASLVYTIGAAVEAGASREELLYGDLSDLLNRGRRALRERQRAAHVAWKLLCQELPPVRNVYYLSTVQNLGLFFKRYDIYYEAHHVPCSVDYWLLCQVPEEQKGVHYVEAYLHRLQIENDFLNCFARADLIGLYERAIPDYEDFLFNLCEPVLTNAVGLALLGQPVRPLNVSETQRNALCAALTDRSATELERMVKEAVRLLCRELGMTVEDEVGYLIRAASGLPTRIAAACGRQDLSKFFL